MIALAFITLLLAIIGAFIIAALIVVYRERVRTLTATANYNAALWAEAEAALHAAQIDLASVDAWAKAEMKRGDELARIAREALAVAHGREFDTGIPMADGSTLRKDPNEKYTVEIIDPILDSDIIG